MKTQEILDNADSISLEATATQNHGQLCTIWPTVKEGLTLLKEFIKNPIVKLSIAGLITAGDAIVGRICK